MLIKTVNTPPNQGIKTSGRWGEPEKLHFKQTFSGILKLQV